MEFLKIVAIFIIWIYIIKFLDRRLGYSDKSSIKGAKGEKKVNKKLKRIKGYKLLKDIMLEGKNGTTQIDHVLIGDKGIFVIETKNYKGSIYGDEESKHWIQILRNRKNQFYSPIRQNRGHIKAISNYLPQYSEFLKSVIVFSDKATIRNLDVKTPVIYIRDIKRYFKKVKANNPLSPEDINNIYNILLSKNITDKYRRAAHKAYLKSKY